MSSARGASGLSLLLPRPPPCSPARRTPAHALRPRRAASAGPPGAPGGSAKAQCCRGVCVCVVVLHYTRCRMFRRVQVYRRTSRRICGECASTALCGRPPPFPADIRLGLEAQRQEGRERELHRRRFLQPTGDPLGLRGRASVHEQDGPALSQVEKRRTQLLQG